MAGIAESAAREPGGTPGKPAVRRRGLLLLLSAIAGLLLTVVWSAEFVDQAVGGTIAKSLLGHHPEASALTSVLSGTVFAFVSGLAGTFTACNIAVFGSVAPMLGSVNSRTGRAVRALQPLGWLFPGMAAASVVYGAVVGLLGTSMPQFSQGQPVAGELSGRTVQSMVTLGVIGLAMSGLGLSALGYTRDPFAKAVRRLPPVRTVCMGVPVGGSLVGRPYPRAPGGHPLVPDRSVGRLTPCAPAGGGGSHTPPRVAAVSNFRLLVAAGPVHSVQ